MLLARSVAHQGRVRELMDERGYDAVIIRDEANLRWLTGAEGVFDYTGELPHAAFITASNTFLHTDSRYYNSFIEHLPADSPWVLDMEVIGIPRWAAERARDAKCRVVAVEDTMELSFYDGLVRGLEDLSICALLPQMHGDLRLMRAVKDEEEIALMKRAQAITDAAFAHMLEFIRPGLTEKQIKLELENFMFENGADGLAFGSIVAAGPNAANPHAISRAHRPSRRASSFMITALPRLRFRHDPHGCRGRALAKMREIYDLEQRTHESAPRRSTPAWTATRSMSSRKIIGDAVRRVLRPRPHTAASTSMSSQFKQCTIRWGGSVVTIEPGVYLPGEFGVRLEDYGLVTAQGFVPFTQSPHDLQVIDC